jgi:Glycosyl hydrolases family 2, sugar binding domain/Glycosyl hydrolases family 2/Glycosyl hydrolases family 2, TIM barrel domain
MRSVRVVCAAALAALGLAAGTKSVSLAGEWRFRLDAENSGHQMNWQVQRFEGELMFLPGSTDQAGYGLKTSGPARGWLSRPYIYTGAAWYQRDVVVPDAWRGKRVTLFLERPHWQTEVWVDGESFGMQNSLATPHVYDLSGALRPGKHRITLCVDNTYKIPVGIHAHSVADHTQTNWNGVVGRLELRAQDPVWIDSVKISPLVRQKSIRVEATVRNATGNPARGEIRAMIPGMAPVTTAVSVPGVQQTIEFTLPLAGTARLWDEYEPALYDLNLTLTTGSYRDEWTASIGLREIATRGKQFVLNGRPVFLRGTLECNIFPLTGYPPMTEEGWDRLFRIAKSYGLNHFRFHSWCPPEAAFRAADRAGFMLHVELPVWNQIVGKDQALDDFMIAEAHRMLAAYGNHPSFTMLCLGNELNGDWKFMDDLVKELKLADNRRLYTFSSDCYRKVPGPTSDYFVTHHSEIGPVRIHGARFTATAGGTDYDFSDHVAAVNVPLVAHELGQWVTYPNYEEISRYNGVLKPRNLEAFRAQLEDRGMADQAKDFQLASGRFSWLVYKEDIETALRTRNFGGVQLLQLQDFPGQGEALIGLLDSFWESKGLLEPRQMRAFFNQTVPLLRFSKFVWTTKEVFTAKAQLAHYGKNALNGTAEWTARDGDKVAGSGKLTVTDVAPGQVADLGEIRLPLSGISRATKLRLTLGMTGSEPPNSWDIWVYPNGPARAAPPDVLVTTALDEAARKKLADGGNVLLLASRAKANTMKMAFLPVFWSLSWFKEQAGTMGILCDPSHPALADFPTDMHSNWQWWELTENAPVFVLDDTAPGFRPIIQVIDDYHRNHKLGAVFEAKVGKGKLLVSSFDIESDLDKRPVARQLRLSLLNYAGSSRFAPAQEMDAALLQHLLNGKE